MSISQTADALLRKATADGSVPGVVAGATNGEANLYLGGFGERVLGGGDEMTPDTVGWLASMTKALAGGGRHAACRAGPARSRRPPQQTWSPP